jgi:hypothetical protein
MVPEATTVEVRQLTQTHRRAAFRPIKASGPDLESHDYRMPARSEMGRPN